LEETMAKKYVRSQILDRLNIHSKGGSKIVKPKPKGYKILHITLQKGEELKCTECQTSVRRSKGHRKVYIVSKTGVNSIPLKLCVTCKDKIEERVCLNIV